MSGKFTPGPWVAEVYDTLEDARQESSFTWAYNATNLLPLGSVWLKTERGFTGLPGCIETTAANAHLIAAAPDMFAALEGVEEFLGETGFIGSTLDEVRAALAKARGETA